MIRPSRQAAPRNPAATSAYLRLLHLGNHGQLHEILHWTERTLALDPDWHAGRARLSLRLLQRFFWYGDPQDLARAQVELKRAIDGGGETLAYPRPLPQAYGHGDFATAEPVFAQWARDGETAAYAELLAISGLLAEASRAIEAYVAMNPYNNAAWEVALGVRREIGDSSGTLEAVRQIVALNPESADLAQLIQAHADATYGNVAAARRLMTEMRDRLASTLPESPARFELERSWHWYAARIGVEIGDRDMAQTSAEWLAQHGYNRHAAVAFLHLDDPRAQAYADRAASDPPHSLWGWQRAFTAWMTEEQRRSPITRQLARQLGLSDEWTLELCRRAAKMPPATAISCDPAAWAARLNLPLDPAP